MNNQLKRLFDKLKSYDRDVLISVLTGCLFAVFGLIQILSVIFAPVARTFDHFALIVVDMIITAVSLVFVLYKNGTLQTTFLNQTRGDSPQRHDSPQKSREATALPKNGGILSDNHHRVRQTRNTSNTSNIRSNRSPHSTDYHNRRTNG